MLMFTLLDIIACSASFGRRYRTCAIGSASLDVLVRRAAPLLIAIQAIERLRPE
jgi:hypothetical protein